jgi:hypothetical protein
MWLEMRKGSAGSIPAEVTGARQPHPKLRRSGLPDYLDPVPRQRRRDYSEPFPRDILI